MTDKQFIAFLRNQTGFSGPVWVRRESCHLPSGELTETIWVSGCDFACSGPDMAKAIEKAVRELKLLPDNGRTLYNHLQSRTVT